MKIFKPVFYVALTDKTVQSQETLLELIYCQATQASDPRFGY